MATGITPKPSKCSYETFINEKSKLKWMAKAGIFVAKQNTVAKWAIIATVFLLNLPFLIIEIPYYYYKKHTIRKELEKNLTTSKIKNLILSVPQLIFQSAIAPTSFLHQIMKDPQKIEELIKFFKELTIEWLAANKEAFEDYFAAIVMEMTTTDSHGKTPLDIVMEDLKRLIAFKSLATGIALSCNITPEQKEAFNDSVIGALLREKAPALILAMNKMNINEFLSLMRIIKIPQNKKQLFFTAFNAVLSNRKIATHFLNQDYASAMSALQEMLSVETFDSASLVPIIANVLTSRDEKGQTLLEQVWATAKNTEQFKAFVTAMPSQLRSLFLQETKTLIATNNIQSISLNLLERLVEQI